MSDEHEIAKQRHNLGTTPWVIRPGQELDISVSLGGRLVLRSEFHVRDIGEEPEVVESLTISAFGRHRNSFIETHRVWQDVEEIAKYVAGDGRDSMRVALADGIRQGWNVPSPPSTSEDP